MAMLGTILRYGDKGYGFISAEQIKPSDPQIEDDIFFRIEDVLRDNNELVPQAGDRCEFELTQGDKGPRAAQVKVIVDEPAKTPTANVGATPGAEKPRSEGQGVSQPS